MSEEEQQPGPSEPEPPPHIANPDHIYDVVIIGAGAAGIGAAVALKHADVENFLVLERHIVGASFALWPAETRFITPSFPTNSIGMLDINSIAIGVSPAFSLETEHPTGEQYAAHLIGVAQYFELPIVERTDVEKVRKEHERFLIETPKGTVRAKHVVWAAGEYQYPSLSSVEGGTLCQHTATIPRYEDLEGDDFIVVGGYESGIDAAFHLAQRGKRVRVFDSGCPWKDESSDPSVALSVYSAERMRTRPFVENVQLFPNTPIRTVKRDDDDSFIVTADNGERYRTKTPPLLAGGFDGSHRLISDLFESREDGFPALTELDESTITPGLFLVGPSVRHDNHVFCFIYKYRQRFAVVAKTIATSLGLSAEFLEMYRDYGMYLDDLSVCGEDCVC
ncbi:MAG: NAD(P)/FAD-dependent oxidoreductase [Myxococcota bacterium]